MISYIYMGLHVGLFIFACSIAIDNRSAWPLIFYLPLLGAWIWIWNNRKKKLRKSIEEFGEQLIALTGSNSGGVHYYVHPNGNPGAGLHSGIALNLATKTVALSVTIGGAGTKYSFDRIRSWDSDAAKGVFFVITRESYGDDKRWRIEMPSKDDRNRWTEIFRQAMSEDGLKPNG